MVTIIFLTVVALIVVTYICSRKILPMLGILKNRYLIEENEPQLGFPIENVVPTDNQDEDLVVPPSSEREGVQKFNEMVERMDQFDIKES